MPPPSQLSRDFGLDATIPCQAQGVPQPDVRWYRNAMAIEDLQDGRYRRT